MKQVIRKARRRISRMLDRRCYWATDEGTGWCSRRRGHKGLHR